MKKLMAMCLVLVMVLSLSACGKRLEGVNEPVDILNTVWDSYAEDEKFYSVGGDLSNMVESAPGAFDLTDEESATNQLVCLPEAAKECDKAASLIHGMNANNFTGAAYHITGSQEAFVKAMEDGIMNNQFICGFPEKLFIANLGKEYTVVAFGAADLLDAFKTKLTEAYGVTEVVIEKSLW